MAQNSYEMQMKALTDLAEQRRLEEGRRATDQGYGAVAQAGQDLSNIFSKRTPTAVELLAKAKPQQMQTNQALGRAAQNMRSAGETRERDLLNRYNEAMGIAGLESKKEDMEIRRMEAQQKRADLLESRAFEIDKMNQADKLARSRDIQKAELSKGKNKKYSTDQYKAGGFSHRIEEASKIMSDLSEGGYDRSGRMQEISSYLPGEWQSNELRQQGQAERNFVNAVLRRESGAAIAPSEFDSAELQYFPRPGDDPQTLKNKAKNRATAIAMMKAEAQGAYDEITKIKQENPELLYAGEEKQASGTAYADDGLPDLDNESDEAIEEMYRKMKAGSL